MTSDGPARDDAVLRSRQLAELAGTTPRALRHYHRIGLLPEVPRDINGYRRYAAHDLVRVLRIRALAASGMPLRRIGEVVDRDTHRQDDVLDELDRELAQQAQRIASQRQMIAELRRGTLPRPAGSESHSATTRFDDDVWTLVTRTGGIDSATAAAVTESLQSEAMTERAMRWYPEFEALEGQEHVDANTADRLAHEMADFAKSVFAATGFDPGSPLESADSGPIAAMVQQMHSAALSPAQHKVWTKFLMTLGIP